MKFNDYYPTVIREIEETLGEIDQTKITYFSIQSYKLQRQQSQYNDIQSYNTIIYDTMTYTVGWAEN